MFVECLMIYFKDESSQVKSKGFHLVCPVRACVLSVVRFECVKGRLKCINSQF